MEQTTFDNGDRVEIGISMEFTLPDDVPENIIEQLRDNLTQEFFNEFAMAIEQG